MGSMERPTCIGIPQPALSPISPVIPSEEMIVRSVFHHHYNDVLDSRSLGRRQQTLAKCALERPKPCQRGNTTRRGCAAQKSSATDIHGRSVSGEMVEI